MFFVCLVLAFIVVLLLLVKHTRSKYKRLVTLTILMIMVGMTCWGYHSINLGAGFAPKAHPNNVFNAVINQPIVWTIGMILLALSIPCALFCILSKSKVINEIDKPLEDQDDIEM